MRAFILLKNAISWDTLLTLSIITHVRTKIGEKAPGVILNEQSEEGS